MTDLRTAAQQALEALEMESNPTAVVEVAAGRWELKSDLAIAALRAALAEPAQEPYCYVYEYDTPLGMHRTLYPKEHNGKQPDRAIPLYTSPPQRPTELVGIVSNLVKGGVVWQRWPADMPDGTRLFGEVQP